LGLDCNRLAKYDLRAKAGIVQWTHGKEYAQRPNFTCMATSENGHVAVGSKDGKIRLYNDKALTQVISAVQLLTAFSTSRLMKAS
jgi:hypothetical protein